MFLHFNFFLCHHTLQLTLGMLSASLSFLMSGLLEIYVTSSPGQHDCQGDISIAWQLPQLFFISIAEATVCVTGLELAYSQAPPQQRQASSTKNKRCSLSSHNFYHKGSLSFAWLKAHLL